MRFYSTTFFCDKDTSLKAHIEEDNDRNWPITIKINESGELSAKQDIVFFCNRNQLFMLADSINTAIQDLIDPVQNYLDGIPDTSKEKESLLEQKSDDKYHAMKDEGEI